MKRKFELKFYKMKYFGFLIALFTFTCTTQSFAQAGGKENATQDKLSYYEQRAKEDAAYEQSLAMENESDEEDFWGDQKQYEKDLKKRDKEAYKAYMKGKRDAYAEHARHCSHRCYHSDHYYHHASFYYNYQEYHYPSRRSTIRTGIRVGAPSLRVGIF
jgi:hypothetical protein